MSPKARGETNIVASLRIGTPREILGGSDCGLAIRSHEAEAKDLRPHFDYAECRLIAQASPLPFFPTS